MNKYFMARIKQKNGTIEKGLEVHDTFESAKQAYHAYLGAYAYGHEQGTDYVACYIVDGAGNRMMWEVWDNITPGQEGE